MQLPLLSEVRHIEIGLSFILTVLTTLTIFGLFAILPPQVPLWYSLSINEQQLAPKVALFLLPISMAVIILAHSILLALATSLDETIKTIVRFCSVFLVFLLTVVFVHTLTLSL